MGRIVEHVPQEEVQQLERIADALEKIVVLLEQQDGKHNG